MVCLSPTCPALPTKHFVTRGVLSCHRSKPCVITHYVPAVIGFSAASDKQLFEAANISDCQEWEKYVVLILDEMHIKEDLVFDKHAGKL